MSYKTTLSVAVAAVLALSSLSSFAQTYDKHGKVIVIKQKDDKKSDRKEVRQDERRNDRNEASSQARATTKQRYYYNARGPEFVRGHSLPRDLRTRQYVVVNHREHRLAAPPRGKQWVQVGADYVLVAVATGIIANIVLNR